MDFFQTKMGQKFYGSTVPTIVGHLDRIATALENPRAPSLLEVRVRVLEQMLEMPSGTVHCEDGFSIVLQRTTEGFYTLSFPSHREVVLDPYNDTPELPEAVCYSNVPAKLVAQILLSHGGPSA